MASSASFNGSNVARHHHLVDAVRDTGWLFNGIL